MAPIDEARLDYELHADALARALGTGGAPVDLGRAEQELDAVAAALEVLRTLLAENGNRR